MMKKTALFLVAVVMVVAVSTAGCSFNVGNISPSPSASPSASSTLTNTYNSPQGFSIKYPSDWAKEEPTSGPIAVLFAVPTHNSSENLNVQAYNLSAGETLSSTTSDILTSIQDDSNSTQIQAGNTTLAGLPAYKIVYTTYDSKGNFVKALQTWTVNAGKEYLITYKTAPSNYDTYASTAQQMIDSFSVR